MTGSRRRVEERYADALRDHLKHRSEATLERAYETGRLAINEGLGVLEMALLHHQVLLEAAPLPAGEVLAAAAFFIESLTPFEMTHRAFREANVAHRRLGERLEGEAKRIAHALHDESGWLLGSVHIALDELARDVPDAHRGRIPPIKELLDRMEQHLRQLSHELRPTILDDLGLLPAFCFLATGVMKRNDLSIKVEGTTEGRLPPAVETVLYRNVQEALSNVAKHARARNAEVRVLRTTASIQCAVRDDGVGLREPAAPNDGSCGLGLIGMRERLDSVRGTLRIGPASGGGTELLMTIPLET